MEIEKKINELLKEKGSNIAELANALEITKQGLYTILKSGSTKVSTLEKIANYFGVPPSYFLQEEIDEYKIDGQLEINDRINELIKKLDITPAKFASQIGLDRPQIIYNILNNTTKATTYIISLIKSKYKNVNIDWIFTVLLYRLLGPNCFDL